MAYDSVPYTTFGGGINLRDQPDELAPGQAYDLLNVTFTERGGVKSRPGYETFNTSSLTYVPDNMEAYTNGSAWQMAVSMTDGTNRRIEVRDAAGGIVAGSTPLTAGISASPNYFTQFGGGTASGSSRATPTLYASNGTDQLRVWTGSGSWSTPTWVITNSAPNPTGMFCAITPWDSRLVNARYAPAVNPNQGGQNLNTVRFSSPTNPLAWDGYEYVDLTPGDGEEIMGMASYGSYVIVFKRTKFFVFYGTAQGGNSLGVPDFQFRTIDAGVGLAARQSLCVAPDGVYFLSEKGVYRTDGGPPQLVSGVLDPFFTGQLPVLYGGSSINYGSISKARMTFFGQQVYVALPSGSSSVNNLLMVFDPRFGWWTIWDVPCAALSPMQLSTIGGNLLFATSSGSSVLGKFVNSATTDAGAAIRSRIKYGFLDYGSSVDKTIRESQVWGLGKFRYGIARNLEGSRNAETIDLGRGTDVWSDGSVATDTWGPDATYPNDVWGAGQAANFTLSRKSIRGINFSLEFNNSDDAVPGAWAINRVVHRVRESRVPSVTKLDK